VLVPGANVTVRNVIEYPIHVDLVHRDTERVLRHAVPRRDIVRA